MTVVQPTPGTPSLMRAINDRAALKVLLEHGPVTRPELSGLIGLSKPTASQLLNRLRDAGLVVLDGRREGLPGRTAETYKINPGLAHVCALDVTGARIRATVAGITGEVLGEYHLPTPGRSGGDAPSWVRTAVDGACEAAGIARTDLNRVLIGIQGALDPRTGRLWYASHIRGWGQIDNLTEQIGQALEVPVDIENDVNLVALAERTHGAAQGCDNFVLLWVGRGIGAAIMINGRLHRGATGGAGEAGYMPMPGAPTALDLGRYANHGLQALAGGQAVLTVLRSHGFRGTTAERAMRAAVCAWSETGAPAADVALREVARRVATGLASVTTLIDPELIVLTGETLLAGGKELRARIEHQLHMMTIPRPPLRISAVEGNPVLAGAIEQALSVTRDELLGSTLHQ